MAKGKARDRRKEQQWRRWIREWRESGLSVRAYCDAHGLAEPSFYAWRRELERRREEVSAFVPVQVIRDEPTTAGSAVELLVAGQRIVRVSPGFDAATLRQVLAVLEEKPC